LDESSSKQTAFPVGTINFNHENNPRVRLGRERITIPATTLAIPVYITSIHAT